MQIRGCASCKFLDLWLIDYCFLLFLGLSFPRWFSVGRVVSFRGIPLNLRLCWSISCTRDSNSKIETSGQLRFRITVEFRFSEFHGTNKFGSSLFLATLKPLCHFPCHPLSLTLFKTQCFQSIFQGWPEKWLAGWPIT